MALFAAHLDVFVRAGWKATFSSLGKMRNLLLLSLLISVPTHALDRYVCLKQGSLSPTPIKLTVDAKKRSFGGPQYPPIFGDLSQ